MHFVFFATFRVRRHFPAAHKEPERVGHVGDIHAEIRSLGSVDSRHDFWLAFDVAAPDVHGGRHLFELVNDVLRVFTEFAQLRTRDSVFDAARRARRLADADAYVLRYLAPDFLANALDELRRGRFSFLWIGEQCVDGRFVRALVGAVTDGRTRQDDTGEGAYGCRDSFGDEQRPIAAGALRGAHRDVEAPRDHKEGCAGSHEAEHRHLLENVLDVVQPEEPRID